MWASLLSTVTGWFTRRRKPTATTPATYGHGYRTGGY